MIHTFCVICHKRWSFRPKKKQPTILSKNRTFKAAGVQIKFLTDLQEKLRRKSGRRHIKKKWMCVFFVSYIDFVVSMS